MKELLIAILVGGAVVCSVGLSLSLRSIYRSHKLRRRAECLIGKVLRHSPTGRVGACVAVIEREKVRSFKAVLSPSRKDAALFSLTSGTTLVLEVLIEDGTYFEVPVNELAKALPEEVEAFR